MPLDEAGDWAIPWIQSQVLRACLGAPGTTVCSVDRQYRYTGFNSRYAHLMRQCWGTEVRMGRDLREGFPTAADRAGVQYHLDRALSGEPSAGEIVLECPHTSRRCFEASFQPIRDAEGVVAGAAVVAREITLCRRGTEAPEASERFEALFEQAGIGMVEIDTATGRFIRVNPCFCAMVGFGQEELLGMDMQCLTHPEDHPRSLELMKDLLSGRIPKCAFEKRFLRKGGSTGWVEVYAIRVGNGDASSGTHFGVVQDITARKEAEATLVESEARFKAIFSQVGVGVVELDPATWCFLQVNPGFANLLGYEPSELAGRSFREVTQAEDGAVALILAAESIQGGMPHFSLETRFLHKAGGIIWGRVTVTPCRQASGRILSNLAIVQDITSHRRDAQAVEEEKAKLQALIRAIPDLVWLKDPEGVYLFGNKRFEDFFGVPAEEVLGRTDYDFMDRELADFFRSYDRRAAEADGPSINEEWITFASDGHRELVETIKTPLKDNMGRLIGVLGIARDVTGRRQDQDRLRKLSAAMEQSPIAIVITARDGAIEFVNPRFTTLTGYAPEEVLGQNLRLLKSGVTPPEVYAGLWKTIRAGQVWRGDLQNRKKDGGLYWESMAIAPVLDDSGTVTHFVALKEDITPRKLAEERLVASEERLRSLFDNMLNGFAYCRMFFDAQGRPEDFLYLDVNEAFGRLTGLKDVTGRRVSEVIPGIREADPGLLESYGRVARTGAPERFETFVTALDMWFSIAVYSPRLDHFVAVFDVITERKRTERAVQDQLEELRRWHELTLGRESRVMELKGEVNALLSRLGEPPRYGGGAS